MRREEMDGTILARANANRPNFVKLKGAPFKIWLAFERLLDSSSTRVEFSAR